MIYLNNAATSWPKPEPTVLKLQSFWGESPRLWDEQYEASKKTICDFFAINDPSRFIVTSGATASIDMVFSGMDWNEGDIVITGSYEHHAIAGWEYRLRENFGVKFKKIKSTATDIFDLSTFENYIRKNRSRVKLVAFTQASNVTGDVLPAQDILDLCRKYQIPSLLDGAQTAGILDISIEKLKPDFFTFAGHKGTMGPHGIGGLYISDNSGIKFPDVNFGTERCHNMAGHCDVGSTNLEGMVALASSMKYLGNIGFDEIAKKRNMLNTRLYKGLDSLENVEIISKSRLNRTYAIAFKVKNAPVTAIIEKLTERECIIGSGFFCCSQAHIELGTQDEGVLRISPGLFTSSDEIDRFFDILKEIISEPLN
ncbi:MAG: aminotransferase class V-fold PLP-dependent enzyme [Spirochaetales bacterium]|uniref:Aminotransferase class V-fold PLP-dependent enzyme n=1 Tax=Candidatus Thalassospirochaeta sargassi TaxID=3119039 RepID=A0AAJ1IEX4_9SPIO|nr:aminotransferase class V-fold PLP-dependent enzyme [Spirochaetales bacterium]